MSNFIEKYYEKTILIILVFMFAVSTINAWEDSAIYDETAHIPAGYSYLKFHDMRLNPEHPPLIKDMAGLPLLAMNPKMDISKNYWSKDINGQWDAGKDLLWQEGNDADKIIFWSRMPIVFLSVILGIFIFFWTRQLAGIAAGLFALILYAFDPNILGHNHFVTTDLGIAAFGTFSFYFFLRFIKEPSWKNVVIGGIFLGFLQLAKFSSVIYFPIYGLVLVIYPMVKTTRLGLESNWKFKLKYLGEYLAKGMAAFVISLVLVWGIYFINIYKMPETKLAETIEYSFPHEDPAFIAKTANSALLKLNKSPITRPLSEYILGIAMVFKRVEGGNGAYFMQKVSKQAFPEYFPVVFALKEPIPTLFISLLALIISAAGVISACHRRFKNFHKDSGDFLSGYIRKNITSLSLFAFILLYSYVSITGNLNIGFRHLFPILPFVYILAAKSIFDFFKKTNRYSRTAWAAGLIFLIIFLVSETAASYPAYMSYFNETAGGPKNGYRYVTDSNADWGQDLKRLKKWINEYNSGCELSAVSPVKFLTSVAFAKEHNLGCSRLKEKYGLIDNIRVNYFGGGDTGYYLGDKYIDWWDSKRPIEPGWYAISANFLQGSIYDKGKKDQESYRWIRDNNIRPVYQVGTSIFIYYLTNEEAHNINK